jgi:nucleoside-diphosphate-sugar epimerase
MRILILGGDGMLGHQLLRHFKDRHDVRVTLRLGREAYEAYRLFEPGMAFYGIDARQMDALLHLIEDFRPEAVVNAIGIVKQRSEAKEVIPSLEINSLLPHRLVLVCRIVGARLIRLYVGKQRVLAKAPNRLSIDDGDCFKKNSDRAISCMPLNGKSSFSYVGKSNGET